MFSCRYCGKEFSKNFNRKRHEKQCQSNSDAMDEDGHDNSSDRDDESLHSLLSTQDDNENDSDDESDTPSEEDSESDSGEGHDRTPWKHLISQSYKDYRNEYNGLIEHFQGEGDSEENAQSKAHNALIKKYRKALRENLVDEILYFKRLRRTPIYQKVMETKRQIIDSDDFDDEEALRSAVKKRQFLLNRLIEPMQVTDTDDSDEEEEELENEDNR